MPLFVLDEINQHPNKYIEGMDKVCISTAFRFRQGTNVRGLISMELTQKLSNIKTRGFTPYLMPSDKAPFIYLDLVALVHDAHEYSRRSKEARVIIDEVKEILAHPVPRGDNNDSVA